MKYILALLATFFLGCAPSLPPLLQVDPSAPLPEECNLYGACILLEDVFVQSFNRTTHIIRKHIAFQNQNGLKYATIPLHNLAPFVWRLEVKAFDSNGKEVYDGGRGALESLRETGSVVVPGIKPGMRVQITAEVDQNPQFLEYEYPLQRDIPVILSRFSLRTYDSKDSLMVRGSVQETNKDTGNAQGYFLYRREFRNIMPIRDIPNQGWVSAKTPRIWIKSKVFGPLRREEDGKSYAPKDNWSYRFANHYIPKYFQRKNFRSGKIRNRKN